MARATIQQVADRAGVSIATVSRVLAGKRSISDDYAERVSQAAEELGYTPNTIARSLRRNKTDIIGMVVPSIMNPFFASLIDSVERELGAYGKQLLLSDSREDVDVEAAHLAALVSRRVDGIIVSATHITNSQPALVAAAQHTALVQLDRFVDGTRTDSVALDDGEAMREVVALLRRRGVRDVAFIGSTADNSSLHARFEGFRHQSGEQGLRFRANWVFLGQYSIAWGREAMLTLWRDGIRPDAVVCAADTVAFGVYQACRELGIDIPTQMLVTGFDDTVYCDLVTPTLTSVNHRRDQMAAKALALLVSAAGQGGPPRRVLQAPELIERGSTAAGG